MVISYFPFFEGYINKITVKIHYNNKLEDMFFKLKEENNCMCEELLNNYYIYFSPSLQNKIHKQNSIFHMYNGHIFITHKDRELNDIDLQIFQKYANDVIRKGKRIFEAPKKITIKNNNIIPNRIKALRIN